jgi:putative FmdB family regulatory protein
MPVYTYRCENCGVQFDQHQKFTDASLTRCPECGKKALRKVYSPVGIVFKGSGFYSTDHKSPSGQVYGSSDKKEATESQAASDKKVTPEPVSSKEPTKEPAKEPVKEPSKEPTPAPSKPAEKVK